MKRSVNAPAPPVKKKGATPPRKTRITLSKLRSGPTSTHRINPVKYPGANCKDCNLEQNTTNHLFNCPSNPTHLTSSALWKDPVAAAEFLNLDSKEGGRMDTVNDIFYILRTAY